MTKRVSKCNVLNQFANKMYQCHWFDTRLIRKMVGKYPIYLHIFNQFNIDFLEFLFSKLSLKYSTPVRDCYFRGSFYTPSANHGYRFTAKIKILIIFIPSHNCCQ